MAFDPKTLVRALSPRLVSKALVALDKSTAVVISVCWTAAFVTLILAVFAVHGAVAAKKEAAQAAAAEPVLPKVANASLNPREIKAVLDRLQRQFPDVRIEPGQNQTLVIKSDDGSKFHQWISALSYVDTMAPGFRWTLREFCVGSCGGQGLMRAVVSGQKTTFSLPPR